MTDYRAVEINAELSIPLAELRFRFSSSGGPGGQYVNRTASRVELRFDLANSPSLNEAQRARLFQALKSYLDKAGILHLVSQRSRSQWRNREDVIARFRELLRQALRPRKRRRRTRPSRASKERRLAEKRRRSEIKKRRRPPATDDQDSTE